MKSSITICLAVLAIGINSQILKKNLIQKASTVNGQVAGKETAGQANSDTSTENFINICDGKTLTNGKQNEAGSCNGIPMGDIPSKNNMVSSIITFPKTGEAIKAGETFDITLKVANLVTGFFTNPLETYYAAPQKLQNGKVVGHTHVTVQDMGNTMNPGAPLAADKFAFFKGIDAKADGNGEVKATVTNGLPAGNYRVCTLSSAANHQAVIMPVAQRGSPDDCTKFEVTAAGGGGNKAAGAKNAGKDAGNKAADAKNAGKDAGNKAADAKNAGKNGDNKAAGANNAGNNANNKAADAKNAGKNGDNKDAGGKNAAGENKNKNDDNNKKEDDKKNANAAKPPAKVNKKRKIKGENMVESNDAEDCGGNGNSDKPKAVDVNSKKSSSSNVEMTKRLAEAADKNPAGAADEDCQTLARRATNRHIENTAFLEGKNEIKKDKRFSRVFIS